MAAQTPNVTAKLEAIYIVASSASARADIEAAVLALDLHPRDAFDDPCALFAEPSTDISIASAWDKVHQLRQRGDVVLADPMWETELGWPEPEPEVEAEESAAVADPRWPIELVRAREAWQLSSQHGVARGEGIVIGHIDTGHVPHPELEGMFFTALGYDFVDDDPDATDPLIDGPMLFPGHGIATGGVIASRGTRTLSGMAPAATLVPFRVSKTVVHVSMKHMVAAIRRAVAAGCHVISISAGGFWSSALRRAVREARDAGVVVVAAAGNYVGFVVWPAQYEEVIACAACNAAALPWRWTSKGKAVAITAPGEAITVAEPGGGTRTSSGTSFATAMVSGAVANWLAFHGRDRLVEMYGAHQLTAVVRDLLAKTARPFVRDAPGMGAGILDLHALLAAPLPPAENYLPSGEESLPTPAIDSSSADELAASLDSNELLAAPQSLADELLFHRALELARAESASPIPTHASNALAQALRV